MYEEKLYEQTSDVQTVGVDTQWKRYAGRTASNHTTKRFAGKILKRWKTYCLCVLNIAV